MPTPFVHLHTHTEFSLLDGAARIEDLVQKACGCGMPAIGISDHGNLFGVPKFVLEARKKKLKPVVGSEFYLCDDHTVRAQRHGRDDGEKGTFHQILFAKNETGYKNLLKLSSISYTEGFYYKPRIDRRLLEQHHEGLIATTCCLASEINQKILRGDEPGAEELFKWYLDLFGADYYVEIQRHGLRDQERTNQLLLTWAKRYGVKVIATNDVHYVNADDSEAHDLLLALQTGADYADPTRFRFTGDDGRLNSSFFFKTPDEMAALFADQPDALANTLEIADKCDFSPALAGQLILPTYRVPEGYADMNAFLAELSWAGAVRRYGVLSTELSERITHELAVIKKQGYEGYFLIVQEFTSEARRRGVLVGPGRGSAAGSVVAYCLGITDIDPLQYDLLFERFLNPERISPPDIDIDFDDEGREEVIRFVVEKYGRQSVSQIITYGTMGAKTAIRDVGRVLGVPLAEVNRIAKLIPERPDIDFTKSLSSADNPDHADELTAAFASQDPQIAKMLRLARALEGTARHTGIHAAGVIIAPGNISDYVPVAINNSKEKIVITQFDGPSAEKAGMLKMDFLGLKTLSILKTAVRAVKDTHGIELDMDSIPLTDAKTFELYQAGDTVATFQFESDGMRKYLRQLKPTVLEDLIAMNALFRPGPMNNIPLFIERKQGRSPIEYPHALLEPILKNTYGIMVYQEQIMQAAQVLAGYSLGQADLLRRIMGKKKPEDMAAERPKFIEGCATNGIGEEKASEIFDTMAKFAEYGFNKSHSAAYSLLAYRTAYLKAHYLPEYMMAVLSHWFDSTDKISFFIDETRRMGIAVLPPDINTSMLRFSVTRTAANGAGETAAAIRFGLGAIKGLGEATAQAVLDERTTAGPFKSIYDFTARVPSKFYSKKVLECLAYAGAFDSLGHDRWTYLPRELEDNTTLEIALQWGQREQAAKLSNQTSLFGGPVDSEITFNEPPLIYREPGPLIAKLKLEKDVLGLYLSAHPLDKYRAELNAFASCGAGDIAQRKGEIRVGGIIASVRDRVSQKGNRYGTYTLEDHNGSHEFSLFGNDYAKWKGFLEPGNCVFVTGRMEARYQGADMELRVGEVRLLDTLMEERTVALTLHLPLAQLEPSLISRLHDTLANHPGQASVRFLVSESGMPKPLPLQSRALRVKPTTAVITELERLGITFHLH
jgi:DNA polymerase-3 subunit alpha